MNDLDFSKNFYINKSYKVQPDSYQISTPPIIDALEYENFHPKYIIEIYTIRIGGNDRTRYRHSS